VRRIFSAIAGRYDLLNRLFSFGIDVKWRREMVSEVTPDDGQPVLDLATGTADVALTLEKRVPGKRLIVGTDFSLPMLQTAADKINRKRAQRIRLAVGDALALPLKKDTFSAVTIAFGLRNLTNREAGLREMIRVLRPGGSVLVLEFSKMDRPVIGPVFRFYFHRMIPFLGGVISGIPAAYRYLPDSVNAFPNPVQIRKEMLDAGLVSVKYRPLTFGIAYLYVGEKAVPSV
jgi:demethylmenaquinone methyltransferase/2-methoxy-6-polyprenyl-1,4-benzoquinol methylase